MRKPRMHQAGGAQNLFGNMADRSAEFPNNISHVHRPDDRRTESGVSAGLQHLATAIHAGLQVDVMRTAQFAGVLVLDVGRGGEGVGGAAETALHRRGLAFWNGHVCLSKRCCNVGPCGSRYSDRDQNPFRWGCGLIQGSRDLDQPCKHGRDKPAIGHHRQGRDCCRARAAIRPARVAT